jgi:exopolyphosphatase/guanosine-5'-triphosphate,3'-diphosphate pyrophosphatase
MSDPRPEVIAAIDVGTNSTKMMIAEIVDGCPEIRQEPSEVTRLGKGVDATGNLDPDAIARTLAAIVRFADEARAAGASTIIAAGTSALRDARNGNDLLDAARAKAGVEIQIIEGDREAQLAYSAVRYDSSLWGGDAGIPEVAELLVFDIGGGSTELIVGGRDGMKRHRSLDIGAVRLTERYVKSDPPASAELASVEAFARETVQQFERPAQPPVVAGIGGTAVNIAAVLAGSREAPIHGTVVTRAQVEEAYDRFRRMPVADRRAIPGLEPERADVIVAGAAILDQLLAYVDAPEFHVSTRGLRYGLLAEYAAKLNH